ncbi:matrixin family metalloprotease [Symbiobacterium terraclitae]|uniref:matrixin family metalloprotease n=1 Tax=Symbiobacterium terraclitae TaxID=557451 RepID=UPI001AE57117
MVPKAGLELARAERVCLPRSLQREKRRNYCNVTSQAPLWECNAKSFSHSVATHEPGHALGLHDENSEVATMNQGRDRDQTYVPQPDDTSGITTMYP